MKRFVDDVCRVLEVESIAFDSEFRKVDGWCSLKGFGLMVLLENDWEAPVSIARFLGFRTVRDLCREVFCAFAARVLGVDRSLISGDTAYGSIPQWDSVAHLRLVMESEKRFGTYHPLETIPSLRRIDDFIV